MFNFYTIDLFLCSTVLCSTALNKNNGLLSHSKYVLGSIKENKISSLHKGRTKKKRKKGNKWFYRGKLNYRFLFKRKRLWRRKKAIVFARAMHRFFFVTGGFFGSYILKSRLWKRKIRIKRIRRWYFKNKFNAKNPVRFRVSRALAIGKRKRRAALRLVDKGSMKVVGRFVDNNNYKSVLDLKKIDSLFIRSSNVWRFSSHFATENMFSFGLDFKVQYTPIIKSFVTLYFTINKLYSFSKRNVTFRKNRFPIVYGVTQLIFFKTFFYLDIAIGFFLDYIIYKKHRLLLIVLKKLLNSGMLPFYENYGLFGMELFFFGKLCGFGGSRKRRYKISFGYRSSMSSNYRVCQYLYEYETLAGRIGSRCKITILN